MKKILDYLYSPSAWKDVLAVLTGAVVFEYWRINNPFGVFSLVPASFVESLGEMGWPVFLRFSLLELPTLAVGGLLGFFLYKLAAGKGLSWLPGVLAAFLGLTFTLEWIAFETELEGMVALVLYAIGAGAGYGMYALLSGAATSEPRDIKMILGAVITGGVFGWFAVLNSNIIFYIVGLIAAPLVLLFGIEVDFSLAILLGALGGFWALRSVQAGVKTRPTV